MGSNKWDQVLFFASQLLTYSNKKRKEGIERKLLALAKKYYNKKQKTRPDPKKDLSFFGEDLEYF